MSKRKFTASIKRKKKKSRVFNFAKKETSITAGKKFRKVWSNSKNILNSMPTKFNNTFKTCFVINISKEIIQCFFDKQNISMTRKYFPRKKTLFGELSWFSNIFGDLSKNLRSNIPKNLISIKRLLNLFMF